MEQNIRTPLSQLLRIITSRVPYVNRPDVLCSLSQGVMCVPQAGSQSMQDGSLQVLPVITALNMYALTAMPKMEAQTLMTTLMVLCSIRLRQDVDLFPVALTKMLGICHALSVQSKKISNFQIRPKKDALFLHLKIVLIYTFK